MQGGGGEDEGEREEEEGEGVVAGGEPPFGEVGFDVEESLEGEADAGLSLFRSPMTIYAGTGILTCCPSTSPNGFALGPD